MRQDKAYNSVRTAHAAIDEPGRLGGYVVGTILGQPVPFNGVHMSIPSLLDEYVKALQQTGSTEIANWTQFQPATDADVAALSAEIGCALPDDLVGWLRTVAAELPLAGNYTAQSAAWVLDDIQSTRTTDFSQHHANITSWKDGRFDDGVIANTYWSPCWVAVAADSCGNQYCVDLAPGPNGTVGQVLAMEFQDGQGPYMADWPTLEAMLKAHISMLVNKSYTIDDEGFIEFDD